MEKSTDFQKYIGGYFFVINLMLFKLYLGNSIFGFLVDFLNKVNFLPTI